MWDPVKVLLRQLGLQPCVDECVPGCSVYPVSGLKVNSVLIGNLCKISQCFPEQV